MATLLVWVIGPLIAVVQFTTSGFGESFPEIRTLEALRQCALGLLFGFACYAVLRQRGMRLTLKRMCWGVLFGASIFAVLSLEHAFYGQGYPLTHANFILNGARIGAFVGLGTIGVATLSGAYVLNAALYYCYRLHVATLRANPTAQGYDGSQLFELNDYLFLWSYWLLVIAGWVVVAHVLASLFQKLRGGREESGTELRG